MSSIMSSVKIILVLTAFLLTGCMSHAGMSAQSANSAPPADLDYSATRLSDNGLFRVTYTSDLEPVPVNELHAWTLHVETADGAPVVNATITVNGDMPEHGHGMPTRPQVTQELGGGDYRVEGMRFQMGGWWTMSFEITASDVTDRVTFNLQLK